MKIAIVGSRDFSDMDFARWKIYRFLDERKRQDIVVSGGARGIDSLAEEVVKQMGMTCTVYEADWQKYGKQAGFIRNRSIINGADYIIAFWDGKSKGTKHSIDLALEQNKPIDIYVRTR